MSRVAISSRYARALFEAAVEKVGGHASSGDIGSKTVANIAPAKVILDQLKSFNSVFESSRDLQIALSNPAIPVGERQNISSAVLARISVETANPFLDGLLKLLISRGRVSILPELVETYESIVFEAEGREKALVRSAAVLTEDYRERLKQALEAKTGKKVEMKVVVEPELISGLVAMVGSERFDGSVRGQLSALQQGIGS